jgi:hypothetical protein
VVSDTLGSLPSGPAITVVAVIDVAAVNEALRRAGIGEDELQLECEGDALKLRGARADSAIPDLPPPEASDYAPRVKQAIWTQAQLFELLDELAPGWRSA